MTSKPARFPGFTPLNNQIFVREGDSLPDGANPPADHPRVVVVFSWGDANPKHVAKFTDGYRKLYPHARQIAVLSPIRKAMTDSLQQRADSMRPAVEAAYPPGFVKDDNVLLTGMSNTGGINYASFIYAYRQMHGTPTPHRLAVWDSTPGSAYMTWETLKRWAYATSMGVAPFVPLTFVVTQFLMGVVLALHRAWQNITGVEPAPVFSAKATRNPDYLPHSVHILYLYGKGDTIIHYDEIEESIAATKAAGYASEVIEFEGSDHVGHMRMHTDKYWGAVQKAWKQGRALNSCCL